MTTTCEINCTVDSTHALLLTSGHERLEAPRSGEFEFSLNIDEQEQVRFEVPNFSHAGSSYSVVVQAQRVGGANHVWPTAGDGCISPLESGAAELAIDVTATPASGTPLVGGGIIRIRPKGKPD